MNYEQDGYWDRQLRNGANDNFIRQRVEAGAGSCWHETHGVQLFRGRVTVDTLLCW